MAGKAGHGWCGNVRVGKAQLGAVLQARLGEVMRGQARRGLAGRAWLGPVRAGGVWSGKAGEVWHGEVRHGAVGRGMAGSAGENQLVIRRNKNMVYQWKIPGLIPVEAQEAGEELERIYQKNGQLSARDVVEESRPVDATLHKCFEWDDSVAAEKYRQGQAQEIIRQIVISPTENEPQQSVVRAFVSISREYHPMEVVVKRPDMMELLVRDALAELRAFQNKYETLSELVPVFEAIKKVSEQCERRAS